MLNKGSSQTDKELIEGRDFTVDPETGSMVFTRLYLLERGYCCGNGCRNCPYRKKELVLDDSGFEFGSSSEPS